MFFFYIVFRFSAQSTFLVRFQVPNMYTFLVRFQLSVFSTFLGLARMLHSIVMSSRWEAMLGQGLAENIVFLSSLVRLQTIFSTFLGTRSKTAIWGARHHRFIAGPFLVRFQLSFLVRFQVFQVTIFSTSLGDLKTIKKCR